MNKWVATVLIGTGILIGGGIVCYLSKRSPSYSWHYYGGYWQRYWYPSRYGTRCPCCGRTKRT